MVLPRVPNLTRRVQRELGSAPDLYREIQAVEDLLRAGETKFDPFGQFGCIVGSVLGVPRGQMIVRGARTHRLVLCHS